MSRRLEDGSKTTPHQAKTLHFILSNIHSFYSKLKFLQIQPVKMDKLLPSGSGFIDPNFPNPHGPDDARIIIYGYVPGCPS